MDTHTLEVLDFERIREMLAGMCVTELGQERARALSPLRDQEAVTQEMDLLDEFLALPNEPPIGWVKDIRQLLSQAAAGSMLTAADLVLVRRTCSAFRAGCDYFRRESGCGELVRGFARNLEVEPCVEEEIERAVDDSAAVRDTASPTLRELRDELRRLRNMLVERMERVVESNPGWFEGGVMVRGERFVVPVRIEERGRVPGVVQASSSSGRTLFVEPIDTIAEQNELQELRDAEREEIQRILRRLSALVASHADELSCALETTARLDVLLAKRRFCLKFKCTRPAIAERAAFKLLQARHPLLLARNVEVVPLTLRMPEATSVVLISGPNAGGKTVILKTVGLFCLLLASGMFLPADEGTELPLFDEVFADIGDEQSLERDLSSFTAHLVRLRDILGRAGQGSLVLLDEVGASTDPEEGAALAAAVLEVLRERRAMTLATTHLSGLKLFVQGEPGMVNAAVEFKDGPTYRLVMGVPGESSALVMAQRAGLQDEVVARARVLMGTAWLDMSARLEALKAELDRAVEARVAAESARREAEQLRDDYRAKVAAHQRTAAEELLQARADQGRLLRETRREIENLVRTIRERQADHDSIADAKRFVERGLADISEPAPPAAAVPVGLLTKGDMVESATFRRRGTIVEVAGGEALVAFGRVKVRVPISDLSPVSVAEDVQRSQDEVLGEYRFEPELNVRGMTRDEAGEAVGRFLDDAAAAGAVQLTIVHGKGAGVLRRMLWERLQRDSRVERIWLGQEIEGGSGVTFVRLRGEG